MRRTSPLPGHCRPKVAPDGVGAGAGAGTGVGAAAEEPPPEPHAPSATDPTSMEPLARKRRRAANDQVSRRVLFLSGIKASDSRFSTARAYRLASARVT